MNDTITVKSCIFFIGRRSSRISPALVSAITLGVALAVSLVGFTTVTILLIKSKITVQSTCTAAIVTLDKIASERDMSVENRSIHDITTNENIAYVVH